MGLAPRNGGGPLPPFSFIGVGNAESKSRKSWELQPREVTLTKYRFEFLDTKGEVSETRYLECEGKEAALDMAGIVLAQTAGASGLKIWNGSQLVQCLKKAST
jgi:hypothetical protein